jgi:hypothetical protein
MDNKDIKQLPFIEPVDIAKQIYRFYPDADPEKKRTIMDSNFRTAYINMLARCLRGRYNPEIVLQSMGISGKVYYYYVRKHNRMMKENEHYRMRVIKGTYIYLYALNEKRRIAYEKQIAKTQQNGGEWTE